MRALLPNRHSLLGSLTLSLGLSSLIACTADHTPPAEPPEINTFNAFVNEDDNSINYYTIKNDVLIPTKVDNYEPNTEGFKNYLFLNTDIDKQGYEYVAYVTKDNSGNSTINLFDLDKGSSFNQLQLTTTSNHLCGLSSISRPSTYAYLERTSSNIDNIHEPRVILQTSASSNCADTLYYEQVNFSELLEEDNARPEYQHEYVESREADSLLIIDYSSSARDGASWKGNYGYLNYDREYSEVSFRYMSSGVDENNTESSWSTQLPYDEPVTFKSASDNHVLFQWGLKLYVLDVSNLFSIDDLESGTTPPQARIDMLFDQPSLVLDPDASSIIRTNEIKQANSFILQLEDAIYLFTQDKFEKIYSTDGLNENTTLSYLLNEGNELLLLIEQEGEKDQLIIVTASGVSSSLMSADEISISMNNNAFYVNTTNLVPEPDGKRAHIVTNIGNDYQITTFEDSSIIIVHDMRNLDNLPLLLSSSPVRNVDGTRQLNGTYLYKFDETKENGRALSQSSRENQSGAEEHKSVDFSYGIFHSLSDIEFISGTVINDNYGQLRFRGNTTVDGVETPSEASFVFAPNQDTPDPDLADQSLTLLQVHAD